MNRYLYLLLLVAGIMAITPPTLCAADAGNNETRLREALRNALIQARTAENDRAISEAEKADLKQKNEACTKQVEALIKQARVDKEKSDLRSRVSVQETQIAQLKQELEKTREELRKSQDQARTLEAARAKLANDVILMLRTIADQKTKNREMHKLASEILVRYEKFGLGEALGAKEPFVGLSRVKLQNYVQDFQDKLSDQRISR